MLRACRTHFASTNRFHRHPRKFILPLTKETLLHGSYPQRTDEKAAACQHKSRPQSSRALNDYGQFFDTYVCGVSYHDNLLDWINNHDGPATDAYAIIEGDCP